MSLDIEKYSNYSFEDFLDDPAFRQWVLDEAAEDEAAWLAFFEKYPQQKIPAEQARISLQEMQDYFQREKGKDLDPLFIQDLKKRVTETKVKESGFRKRILIRRISVAASILLLLGFGALYTLTGEAEKKVFATEYGEWKTVYLPDSSEVKLHAKSEISYVEGWELGKDREIWLKGEAFFKVRKDVEGTKFKVFTQDLSVEVLGTSFNVENRGEHTEVFLEEGKVRLDLGEEEKLMSPGDFASYSTKENKLLEFKKSPKEKYISWTQGSLVFRNTSVSDIFKELEQIYGYELICLDTTILNQRMNLSIPLDRIDIAIPIVELVLGQKIKMEKQTLLIEKTQSPQ